MSTCENVQPTGVGGQSHQNAVSPVVEGPLNFDDDEEGEEAGEEEVEDEEDEDEDVDFNPFLKGTPSPEASSSLSSEIEGLDGDVDSRAKSNNDTDGSTSKLANIMVQDSDIVDIERCEEETVMQGGSPEPQNTLLTNHNKRKSSSLNQLDKQKENGSNRILGVNDGMVGEPGNATYTHKPILNSEDESDDAICRRTRARYSLASFSLDELEAFLQETDDEDDVQNVDDEEEYRKFLAAVLLGGEANNQSAQETQNVDDDDEDNDADFEIELEEALESDYEEGVVEKAPADHNKKIGWRPETRQNKRKKASVEYERKLLEQTKRPLRPLLPITHNGPLIPIPNPNQKTWIPEAAGNQVSSAEDGLINGFTPYQIGQLHCLIHEHVQLLIQTYSICVLDPSRQDVASQLQGLIFEMLHKRDEVKACRSKPYPDTYFSPPYVCSSVPEVPQVSPAQCASDSSAVDAHRVYSPQNIQMPDPQDISSRGQDGCVSYNQTRHAWMPSVGFPVLTILDVAPLNLVGRYMDEVNAAVREYRQRHVESSCNALFDKEPLFPVPSFPIEAETNSEVSRTNTLSAVTTDSSAPCQQPVKKTLAATLVERTMQQPVALVPKKLANLTLRFFPLFNSAFFPHKPPPLSVANRILFTDSEDELLALGMLEYNTDWKAIQLRFLPCKSKHQIFVRQKNRCSSKAPQNPIKAVRKMKTSPLTVHEMQAITEGLKVFKLDWMSISKFIVPHRDPSLLPRQWRTALGTQKSYKHDAAKKEKRRLYEYKRRKQKAADSNTQLTSDKEEGQAEYTGEENVSGDDNVDNADESYVHEAFLADWRPGASKNMPSGHYFSNIGDQNLWDALLPQQGNHIRQPPFNGPIVGRALTGNIHGSPCIQQPYMLPQPSNQVPNKTLNASKPPIHYRPYRARKSNSRVVKLAPDLPPVNLPPSVRVIPKSAFGNAQLGAFNKVYAPGAPGNVIQPIHQPPRAATSLLVKATGDKTVPAKENAESGVVNERGVVGERISDSDLHMHPLLFQAPEPLPYYPLNAGNGASSSFSFFAGNQPQLNLTLLYDPQQGSHAVDSLNKSTSGAYGIDFHPLLQRTVETNCQLQNECATGQSAGKSAQRQNPRMKSVEHCAPVGSPSIPSSPKEKNNELDLEIHLSSSTKDDAVVSRHATAHPEYAPPKETGRYGIDDTSDQSHSGIVMEQEELSDSDEEVEENVEFECEEMTDSDGEEGSDSEQIDEVHDKEPPSFATEKVVTDANDDDQRLGTNTPSHSRGSAPVQRQQTPPSLKLGLTCPSKDASSSWLSLDSCAPTQKSHSKPKNENSSTTRKAPAAKKMAPNRSSRSSKQTSATAKHDVDIAKQLSLGPLSTPTSRKPRKRASRATTGLNIGMTSRGDARDDA